MRKTIITIIISLVLVFGAGLPSQAGVIAPDLAGVLESLGPDDDVSVIVTLSDQVDVKKIKDKDKGKLRYEIIKALKDKAETQKPLKDFLKQKKAKKITSFWIFNGLAVTAPAEVIQELANQQGVETIRLDDILRKSEPTPAAVSAPEWNINAIRAPELWGLGFTGAGTVVATMDTGVDANHPDLASRWRGGANSWHDPNGEHATPHDSDGHGTQVMGVLVGGDAGGTAIGVAPGAQWIAVKMYNDAGSTSYSVMHLGFQWLLDPDDNPNTNDLPDVVNNSWGFSQLIGECFTEFQPDIQALKAAQIAVVFSAGNGGPYSSTSESPANYPESFAVGAVDDTLAIAYFSGRGPSACDGSIYPEVAAPGVNIRTADLTFGGTYPDSYADATGTSIAAPHVSGAMALLLSAHPEATVDDLEQALEATSVDLGPAGPDNNYGLGLIDCVAAENWIAGSTPACTDSDGDGFFAEAGCGTEPDCVDNDPAINPGACDIKGDGIDQDCDGRDRTKGKACPDSGNPDPGGGDTGGSEGKGKTCSDGLDNDGDGFFDCADSDCSSNKACK